MYDHNTNERMKLNGSKKKAPEGTVNRTKKRTSNGTVKTYRKGEKLNTQTKVAKEKRRDLAIRKQIAMTKDRWAA